jgi:ketosteroid isomerase-like protein
MIHAAKERQEIHDLIERSSDVINHQEWSSLMAMMTEDVVWERLPPTPWVLHGRAAVHGFLTGNDDKIDILHYAVSASSIDLMDEANAVARSTMSELIRIRATGVTLRVVGTYADRFVKLNGLWFFQRRTITPRYEHETDTPTRIFRDVVAPALEQERWPHS